MKKKDGERRIFLGDPPCACDGRTDKVSWVRQRVYVNVLGKPLNTSQAEMECKRESDTGSEEGWQAESKFQWCARLESNQRPSA
ncbi:hypothetical protein NITMOv2_2338 [Nitrospira moscoviensis]|uniref:Uncharacterized protein n=1 Tax=Nitrospira moscoviensis TaxID=42253 RepID=A0A0K2GCS7_NITMO|nr:hypothetical protein NITMOv2_2338 [Nitrospira moscoviensis]